MFEKKVCEYCGKKYDVDEVKDEFHSFFMSCGDDIDYDDYMLRDLCLKCAIQEYSEGMGTYLDMLEYLDDDD